MRSGSISLGTVRAAIPVTAGTVAIAEAEAGTLQISATGTSGKKVPLVWAIELSVNLQSKVTAGSVDLNGEKFSVVPGTGLVSLAGTDGKRQVISTLAITVVPTVQTSAAPENDGAANEAAAAANVPLVVQLFGDVVQ